MTEQIFVIGSPTQDIFVTCPDQTIDPKQRSIQLPLGVKIDCQSTITIGGNAANVAVTLARAGCQPRFIGRAGDDRAGRDIRDQLQHQQVDVGGLSLIEKDQTGHSVILLAKTGERTILAHHGPDLEPTDWQAQLRGINPGDWVYLSSIGDTETLAAAISQIASRGGRVALNPASRVLQNPQGLLEVIDRLTMLIANREEMGQLFADQTMAELATMAHKQVPLVVVTDGRRGSVVAADRQLFTGGLYQPKSPVVDRTGAGDAFAGGFLAGAIFGQPIETCLAWAAANSSAVVGQVGSQAGILPLGQVRLDQFAVKSQPLPN